MHRHVCERRQLHTACFEHLVRDAEERSHAADAEVIHRLIHDFLHLHRRETRVERACQLDAEFVGALAAQTEGLEPVDETEYAKLK